MRPETEPWWKQAEADLATCRTVFAAGHFYASSWFAQQSAEKALKAVLIERAAGTPPPRSHDLMLLGQRVGAPPTLDASLELLDPLLVRVRYPTPAGTAPVDAVTAPDAHTHLSAAEGILEWVRREL